MPITTRFAPSPTGMLHVGGYRTALFNFLFARQNKGKFVLRIEDTDKKRSKTEYEKDIIEGMSWLELNFDEKTKQSEREEEYKKYLKKMIAEGKAYVSKEKPAKEGDREEVIRFKNPNIKIKFKDLIRKEVEFDTTELGDFVIAKSLEEPLYHLAVVVDDYLSGVTHIIRGEDHISNTPRQILLQEAIGASRPVYAHIPLILAPDKSKLSKRNKAASLPLLKKKGFLPEAVLNYMALLGWNPGDNREIFSKKELIETFDIKKVQKSGAIFSEEKLRWINKEHLKRLSKEKTKKETEKFLIQSRKFKEKKWELKEEQWEKLFPVIFNNMEVYSDVSEMLEKEELNYFFEKPNYKKEDLLWKDEKSSEKTARYLYDIIEKLHKIPEDSFISEQIKESLWDYATEKGRGAVLWPMRYALTGKNKSPDPFQIAYILGKEESLERLDSACKKLEV